MPIKIPRIPTCSYRNCMALGIGHDNKCIAHTVKDRNYNSDDASGFVNPLGVEIECYGPAEVRIMAKSVVCDCSLDSAEEYWEGEEPDTGGEYGHELRLLAEAHQMGNLAALTAVKIKNQGGWVNDTCGLHVHMDMKQVLDPSARKKVIPYIEAMQPVFHKMFRQRWNTEFVRPVGRDIDSHYCWISASYDLPTLEIRIHEGTIDPEVLIAWIKVCRKLQSGFQSVLADSPNLIAKKMIDGNVLGMFSKRSIAREYLEMRL